MNKTNELYILDRELNVINTLIIDDININEDIVSPQKTVIEIPLDKGINASSFVLIKENGYKKFLGIIQDVVNEKFTTLYAYPLVSVLDIDCKLTNINGDVAEWIINTLNNNFVLNDDKYIKLPLLFEKNAVNDTLQLEVKTNNLFEVLLDIFLKTGIYVDFDLGIINGKLSNIICTIKKSSDDLLHIKHDNPLFVEEPTIELSQAQALNKVIYIPNENNKTYTTESRTYYLLQDNTLTQDSNAIDRVLPVVQSIQTYTDEDYSTIEQKASDLLLGNVYNHQITIKVLNNNAYKFELYKKVKYYGKKYNYLTYITAIERVSDKYSIIRLGVLRTRLTDTIKGLNKQSIELNKSVEDSVANVTQSGNSVTFEKNNGSKTTLYVTGSGEKGDKGDKGDPATVSIGTTTTLEAGSNASVTNSGTPQDAILNFGIPKGDKGDKGDKGEQGSTGQQGIQGVGIEEIYQGNSTITDDTTITPLTIQLTSGATKIFEVYAKNGEKGDKGDAGDFDAEFSNTSTNALQNQVITKWTYNQAIINGGLDDAIKSKASIINVFSGSSLSVDVSGYTLSNAKLIFVTYKHTDEIYFTAPIVPSGKTTQTVYSSAYIQPDQNATIWGRIKLNYSTNNISLTAGFGSTIESSRTITRIDVLQ